ncbi:unnamed protein product [Mytilus coruscus]|uniref:Uncharacterized protein n=1 Tax=Mytilus coruscus TaxID=42192 RepID=A0A6J8D8U2_MYTCO|nr:unnamed protein product [Mytilus coruscus]
MATKFKGNIFYEYHKAFAKKVAAIKFTKGLTVDWSIRDEKLYSSVCLGRAINTCGVCGSSLHSTVMCYLSDTSQGKNYHSQPKRIPTTPYSKRQSVDIDGRPKLFHKGKEIFNYYLAVDQTINFLIAGNAFSTCNIPVYDDTISQKSPQDFGHECGINGPCTFVNIGESAIDIESLIVREDTIDTLPDNSLSQETEVKQVIEPNPESDTQKSKQGCTRTCNNKPDDSIYSVLNARTGHTTYVKLNEELGKQDSSYTTITEALIKVTDTVKNHCEVNSALNRNLQSVSSNIEQTDKTLLDVAKKPNYVPKKGVSSSSSVLKGNRFAALSVEDHSTEMTEKQNARKILILGNSHIKHVLILNMFKQKTSYTIV